MEFDFGTRRYSQPKKALTSVAAPNNNLGQPFLNPGRLGFKPWPHQTLCGHTKKSIAFFCCEGGVLLCTLCTIQ